MQKILAFAFLLLAVQLCAAQDCTAGAGSYNTAFGSTVTWQVDCDAQTISFTHIVTSSGWVAVGWNTQKAMNGADVVFGWVSDMEYISDVKNGNHVPPTISSVQTVTSKSITSSDGVITLSFTKPLVTTDPNGISIAPSSTLFLLAATGPSNPPNNDISQAPAHFSSSGAGLMDVTPVNFFAVPSTSPTPSPTSAPAPTPAPAPAPAPAPTSYYGSSGGYGSGAAPISTSSLIITGKS